MEMLKFRHISNCINKYKYIKHIIIFSLFFIVFAIPKKSSFAANQSIKVSPLIHELQLTPGQTTSINLNIENLSDASLGIHAEISGLDETNQNIFTDQHPSALMDWTTIGSPDIILDPISQKSISIAITPPKNAKESGYYETIFLTPIISSKKEPGSPTVLTRIGAIVLATIGETNYNDLAKKVNVKDFKPDKYIFEKSPAILTFSVENKYFTHFTAKPFLTIKPLFGKEQTIFLEEKHILPGVSKSWELEVKTEKSFFYQAQLAVSVGGGNQILTGTWFFVFPYKLIFILILSLGILYFAIFKRGRIKRAVLILIGKHNDT